MHSERKPQWLSILCLAILATLSYATSNPASTKRPNVVFILTDDQDLHMDSLDYMPYLQKHLLNPGTLYKRFYCTISLCCPSRASLWTGLMSHNTNVTDLSPPYGGYTKFMENGFNDAYLPIWLKAAGYSTYYIGKFLNYHDIGNYDKPFPAGWTGTDFLVEPYTYDYFNPGFQRNHDPPVNFSGVYNTDAVANRTLAYLDEASQGEDPFFLVTAPIAPHSHVNMTGSLVNDTYIHTGATTSSPIPAERYAHLFPNATVPRTPSFNPADPNGVSWISELPRQNQTNIDFNDSWYRNRLRALQSVDEMIDQIVTKLDDLGILDNTFIFYTTDNGYHIGQHRLQPSKQCAYKEDVNIPLIVRGPGVASNRMTNVVTSMTDLAPTFLKIIGAPLRDNFDGAPIPLHAADIDAVEQSSTSTEHVNIEQWGTYYPEPVANGYVETNNSYKALRIIGSDYDLLYTVWCSGDHELYDLVSDPNEIDNLYHLYIVASGQVPSTASITSPTGSPSSPEALQKSTWIKRLIPRLDALTMVGKTCKADTCRNPWAVLHPQGNVHNLHEALNPKYDLFYSEQKNKVHFTECIGGYLLDNEMPFTVQPYEAERSRHGRSEEGS